jgi:pimeloyl-ACP methyl ester carboxylesterase
VSAPEHRFVPAGDLRLHHLDFGGSGRPIVCLHGVTGHAWMWRSVGPGLTALGHVRALDMRGHGDSQWSPDGSYSTDDHVADLTAVLATLGDEPVDLVGLSWGGLVSLAYASANPGRVRRLALVDVPPSFAQGPQDVFPRPKVFAAAAEASEWERQQNPHAPDDMIQTLADHGTRPAEGGLARKHDPFFFSTWPFRADDRWDQWRALDIPTLLVHGANSVVLSTEVADEMVAALPGVRFERLEHCGHLVPVERPDALVDILADWVR